jgi:arylsulfate sulfotransferase
MKKWVVWIVVGMVLASCAPSVSAPSSPSAARDMTAQQGSSANLLDGAIVITKNPYGNAPLTAEAVFRTTVPTRVSLTVLGESPLQHDFSEMATTHRVPILGLYPGRDNRVRLTLTSSEHGSAEETVRITTDPLPSYFPKVAVQTAPGAELEPGWTLSQYSINPRGQKIESDIDASLHLRGLPFMFDENGDIRYYLDLTEIGGLPFEVGRLQNGHWVFGEASDVFEYDLLGKRINRWAIPGYRAHHEVTEKPDGNLLVAVHKTGTKNRDGGDTNGDHIIELARDTGEIVREWDLRQVLDVYRRDFVPDPVDWFHMNAIWYSEADDSLVVSGRSQGVVKLTRDNELVWILAPHKGWGRAGIGADKYETREYLLTAVDAEGLPYPEEVQQGDVAADDFDWVWGQHAPMYLPNGNLFVFDNGFGRNFKANFAGDGAGDFSRGVEYVIDEEAKTLKQVWEYGAERGSDYFSLIISDVDYLPVTGNRLIMPGIVQRDGMGFAYATEVSAEGELVADAEIQFKGDYKTDAFFGEIVYRSERLTMYPN